VCMRHLRINKTTGWMALEHQSLHMLDASIYSDLVVLCIHDGVASQLS